MLCPAGTACLTKILYSTLRRNNSVESVEHAVFALVWQDLFPQVTYLTKDFEMAYATTSRSSSCFFSRNLSRVLNSMPSA